MTEPVAVRLRKLLDGGLDLPAIGSGATPQRWQALTALAREDVSLGRLAEAHVDALQILGEAGRQPEPGMLYGVWASEHPGRHVTADRSPGGGMCLDGVKAFCTGAGLVDRALVTVQAEAAASADDGALLLDLPVGDLSEARIDHAGWVTPALADTATAAFDLGSVEVSATAVVGAPGWYLRRPGFWDGAVGPAACWAGAALGLVDHAAAHPPEDPHGLAHLGAITAQGWAVQAALAEAGREMDEPGQPGGHRAAQRRALRVRHLVDTAGAEITERFSRTLGPRPLVADSAVIERIQALALYRRQCHGERDLAVLGELAAEPARVRAAGTELSGDHRRPVCSIRPPKST